MSISLQGSGFHELSNADALETNGGIIFTATLFVAAKVFKVSVSKAAYVTAGLVDVGVVIGFVGNI